MFVVGGVGGVAYWGVALGCGYWFCLGNGCVAVGREMVG